MVNLTTDYKTQMLEWLTGNYQVEQKVDQLSFYEASESSSSFYDNITNKLQELFGSTQILTDPFNVFQGDSKTNNGEGFTLIFGGYNGHGYIMLLDENSNIEYTITEYSSGTPFKPIKAMGMAEDGTFFMVEETDTYPRFVMLNNILAKLPDEEDYQAILRKSYIFSTNYFYDFFPIIKKAIGQSRYLITTRQHDSGQTNIALELVINVGTPNEWNIYTAPLPSDTTILIKDTFATWDINGDISFKLGGIQQISSQTPTYVEFVSSNTSVLTRTSMFQIQLSSVFDTVDPGIYNVKIYDLDTTYLGYVETKQYSNPQHIGYVDYNNNLFVSLLDIIPSKSSSNTIWFYSINNEILFCITTKGDDNKIYPVFGRIINNNIYYEWQNPLTLNPTGTIVAYFSVSKQFNLYQYTLQANLLYKIKEIYNFNNYNGAGYQDYNSMIPNSCVILDTSDLITFARNLYDRLVQGASTTSIMQIPYDYVNGITLKTQQLFGETNKKLIESVNQFTKNIYEEVMISFINMITMQNINNPDNIIKNITGAIKLNQSIATGTSVAYNNSKLTKIRINYNDNTTKIMNISSSINDLTATYNFLIYVDKSIDTIDLISNDETTTYCSIDASNYEIGKYYKITQEAVVN